MIEGDNDEPGLEDKESSQLRRNSELAASDLPDEGGVDSNVITAAPYIRHQPDPSESNTLAASAVMTGQYISLLIPGRYVAIQMASRVFYYRR